MYVIFIMYFYTKYFLFFGAKIIFQYTRQNGANRCYRIQQIITSESYNKMLHRTIRFVQGPAQHLALETTELHTGSHFRDFPIIALQPSLFPGIPNLCITSCTDCPDCPQMLLFRHATSQ
jgi:hypothetical protein